MRQPRRCLSSCLIVFIALAPVRSVSSQVVTSGPPPETRALLEQFVTALNSGSAEVWETFAQRRLSPDLLQKQSADERRQQYERLRAEFGTVELGRVMRRGPDAPLELNVTGSTGATGIIALQLVPSSPPVIGGLRVELGSPGGRAAGAAPEPPIDSRMSNTDIEAGLDRYVTKLAADEMFSGVVLVARNGVPLLYKAYGLANRAASIPNTVRTRFNVGSINKTFTQVAIRQLIREGKLTHGDTLGKFFPDYPQAVSRSATVEQLLTHRAGVADFFGPDFARTPKSQFRSNADYFRFVGTLPPTFVPGARNQYCNGCYITLGAIVEQVSGMPYEAYVAEHVFKRAEMTSTGYPPSDKPQPDIAIGYTRRGDGPGLSAAPAALRSNVEMHGVTGSAAGGGYSTAMDLLTYVKAVRSGRFPGTDPDMGIAGGAPGTNAIVEAEGEWVVIVLSNFDPPSAEQLGLSTMNALRQ